VWRADLLEASVSAWPRAVLLPSTWMMIMRATESGFCVSSWIGSTVGTPVRRGYSHVIMVGVLSFTACPFSGKEHACSRV